jgi:hypothetical protein
LHQTKNKYLYLNCEFFVFTQASCCLDYENFVTSFKIFKKHFGEMSLAILVALEFQFNFSISLSIFAKKPSEKLSKLKSVL